MRVYNYNCLCQTRLLRVFCIPYSLVYLVYLSLIYVTALSNVNF
jgi:hypothetical protein